MDVLEPVERKELTRTIYTMSQDDEINSKVIDVLLKPGDDFARVSRQIRIPYDEGPYILASDHPDTLSCITSTSELVLNLTFEQYEGGETPSEEQYNKPSKQLVQIRCPAIFSSCFCRLDYSKLPAYSKDDHLSLSRQSSAHSGKGAYDMNQCMCKELDEAEEKEYGVSREEVHARWKAEQAGRDWLESVRQKLDGAAAGR